ncbi:hypothetical protein [Sporohalobacter salinus]|uniref:hypothetical protein n=1 Tax=Sporohalobacter salinus TaxID=1494606 RepID=UPI00195F426C|nr:hypothetical protein [Sporohalobacter salinus]MBM7624918.1 hypothetical protein [Sporohalobacter salinus]
MSNYFKEKVNKFIDKDINNTETPKKPEISQTNDIIIEQKNDMACFQKPVLIPRHIYEEKMNKFTCKAMYSSLYVLMKYCNSNGVVSNQTTKDLARYYDYKDCRNIRSGLSKLEDINIITINKNTRPFTYQINDYHFEQGGFVVPEQYMQSYIKNTKLKKLRLEWYYMLRNLHSPLNKTKFNLRLDNLKKVINADSYNEVVNLANDLKNKFFNTVDTIITGAKKGSNKLKTKINNITLGILETSQKQIKNIKQHFKFNDIKYIFEELDIKPTLSHFKEAFNLIDQYAEICLLAVKDNCTANRFKSNHNSIGYFEWMLQLAQDGGIQPQY